MSATGAGQLHERVHVRSWIRTTTFLLLTLLRCQDATEYIRNPFGFPREAKNETRKIKFIQQRMLCVWTWQRMEKRNKSIRDFVTVQHYGCDRSREQTNDERGKGARQKFLQLFENKEKCHGGRVYESMFAAD